MVVFLEEIREKRNLSERFEVAFNQIHDQLCIYANEPNHHISFTEVLAKAKSHHKMISTHYDLLKQCSKLRNAMVHRKIKESFYIAEPHEEVVREIEKLADVLLSPPTSSSIASHPVEFFYVDAPLSKVLACIEEKKFSQFPIYEDKQCLGLLTEGAILQWIARHLLSSKQTLQDISIQDIFHTERISDVVFCSTSSTIFDVQSLFQSYVEKKQQKLEAIVLTETGSNQELPKGIISSWDLVQLRVGSFPLLRHT